MEPLKDACAPKMKMPGRQFFQKFYMVFLKFSKYATLLHFFQGSIKHFAIFQLASVWFLQM